MSNINVVKTSAFDLEVNSKLSNSDKEESKEPEEQLEEERVKDAGELPKEKKHLQH